MKKIKIILTCAIGLTTGIAFAQTTSAYKTAVKISVPTDGGWDYLISDDSTGRLFVSHGTIVQVVDSKKGTLLATIPDTKGVHGIALAKDLNKAFISNGRDTSVTIIDLTTYAFITKIKVTGKNPDAILYDQFSHKVFVWNGRTSNCTVIDAKTNTIAATIDLPGKPEFSVTDGNGKIFVNIEDKNEICLINATTFKVEQTWSVAPGDEPSGLAFDKVNHRLFSVCGNKLMVIVNSETGKIITTLPIGDGVDGAAFDAVRKRAYSSNGEGNITVVQEENENSFKVLETIPTQESGRTICINATTGTIYVPAASFGATPEATKENPRPRASINPGSFVIYQIEPTK